MKDNNSNYGELLNNSSPLLSQLNNDKDINSTKLKLLNFLNEYDIFDVDFITYDDVEEDLATPKSRKELIYYLFLVKQSEDENNEFTNKLDEIIKDIDSFDDLERN